MMQELKPLHTDHNVEVPRRVWNQVEGRLNNEKQKTKLLRLKMLSGIAACLVFAFILSYASMGLSTSQSNFASNGNYKSMVFENLEVQNANLYDFKQVKELKTTLVATDPSFAKRRR